LFLQIKASASTTSWHLASFTKDLQV
jgi:hypothetical protein